MTLWWHIAQRWVVALLRRRAVPLASVSTELPFVPTLACRSIVVLNDSSEGVYSRHLQLSHAPRMRPDLSRMVASVAAPGQEPSKRATRGQKSVSHIELLTHFLAILITQQQAQRSDYKLLEHELQPQLGSPLAIPIVVAATGVVTTTVVTTRAATATATTTAAATATAAIATSIRTAAAVASAVGLRATLATTALAGGHRRGCRRSTPATTLGCGGCGGCTPA